MTKTIQKTISMPCHPRFLGEVRTLVREALDEAKIQKHDRDLIVLALDEAVSSIVQYAKFKGYENEVSLTIDINDVRFKATLVDSLNVYDLSLNGGQTEAQVAQKLEKERSFTMGVFLIRQIMDEIAYTYKKGFQNELELIKFL
ncbi:MAG: ATP-binding protein [Planctomycetes bacterium]|nr:ATP-binding protein [Planctomycetota bacterium]